MTTTLVNLADELPCGGLDPSKFDWFEAWHPVYYVEDLDKNNPTPFTLLGKNIVIWWDKQGNCWRVLDDQCPHRLALLSEGRINEQGLIECPYHGWCFSGSGDCEVIPQQKAGGTAETSARARVSSYPTEVKQGLLFVYPGNPENAAKTKVPIIDPLEESPEGWVCISTFRDLPYDALTLLENVLDSSHIPYTHHGTVGNRSNAAPVELQILEFGKQGFSGIWPEGPRKGKLGAQETKFIAPNLMWHDLTSKQFGRTMTVVYATPISKGRCRLFARFPFKFPSPIPALVFKLTPRWYSHLNQNSILEDDQIFLHYQERYLAQQGGSNNFAKAFYLPTAADNFVIGLRKWVNEFDADLFCDQTFSPPLAKEELLDRYHSHTLNCASCRQALANLQKLRLVLAIIGAIALILSPLLAIASGNIGVIIATVVSLLSLASWLSLAKLESRFYQGEQIPKRNLVS